MLNVAAAFGGGFFIKQQLDKVQLPSFRRAKDSSSTFKLSVRVIACAAPALKEPGVWARQRPRLEVTLGDAQKDTEFADYVGSDPSLPSAGACARECPWRFGDSLTFVATIKDVQGPGLRLRLRAHSDVSLGPLQLQFSRVADLGEAAVDLRRRVLPACVRDPRTTSTGVNSWESPLLLIPLLHVRGGVVCAEHDLGQPTAHVALVISVNEDPEALLDACGDHVRDNRPMSDVFASRADHVMRWLDQPVDLSGLPGSGVDDQARYYAGGSAVSDSADMDDSLMHRWVTGAAAAAMQPSPQDGNALATMTPNEISEAEQRVKERSEARAAARGASLHVEQNPLSTLQGPDLDADGWVCRKGPQGRVYWHHRALGPAPWESSGEQPCVVGDPGANVGVGAPRPPPGTIVASSACPSSLSSRMESRGPEPRPIEPQSFGPIVSPDLPSECWVSHEGKDGRVFWHNTALGPAPWERQPEEVALLPKEESRVEPTSSVDEVAVCNLHSYSRELATTLSRGNDGIRREILGFFDEQLRALHFDRPVKSNFAPFEFRIGNAMERIVIEISIRRLGDVLEVSHGSRCSTITSV